jgi:hypothetical protein
LSRPDPDVPPFFVEDRSKDLLWEFLIAKFTLPTQETPERENEMRRRVKYWALSKMAEQFKNFKKILYAKYLNDKKKPPTEWKGPMEKQQPFWDIFIERRESELAKERSAKNKLNAAKKYITIRWVQVDTRLPSQSGMQSWPK